ncbi:hypothetical protein Rsub_06610 [Raphidocelis subcapitata]|uniref:Meiotic nuclear division protein 1 homolog n=1 Tax=Raphidocelis subcapitata TaxID=307507 RepID=A0A2V0P8J6_9CHLO|nr:hypothetical protein Rsub_06610 [Raphidocelis subcapitata]|eukprot:GBF93477.1 hypothetical protein Rsub_06610 [Raphidocelis subcapitata]
MSKKRGLSLEEKRDKVLEVFLESADVFLLKDVEKIASRRGVVLQSVKEVLQSLVDDDLVHCEKIGISNFFWSFPAEASTKISSDIQRTKEQLAAAQARRAEVAAAVEAAKEGKEDSDDRAALAAEAQRLQALLAEQDAELRQYQDSDPEAVAAMRTSTKVAQEAANRSLDNVYALLSWCRKRFEGREADIAAFFADQGFNENLEYFT